MLRTLLLTGLIVSVADVTWGQQTQLPATDALPAFVLGARADEPCPDDSITGQFPSACPAQNTVWYFYSDVNFSSGTMHSRVRCENFPKTGNLDPNDPNDAIGTIRWYGVNVADPIANGCSKGMPGTYQFRIRFYPDNAGTPNPDFVYEEIVTPTMTDTGETVLFSGATIPAIRWQYTAALTTSQHMARGWFSICGTGSPTCFSLWEGSGADGGDNRFFAWFEVNGVVPGPAVTGFCDLDYCFVGRSAGACCDDCTRVCSENIAEVACIAMGGRFLPGATCEQFGDPNIPGDPNCPNVACGEALGACCHNDGTCTLMTCQDCTGNASQPCRGDANCDGIRNLTDVDPFVAVLSGAAPCRFENVDVNGDGVINFDDIDPFVQHLGIPCPVGPICRGDADCDGDVDFDDLDDLDNIIYHGAVPCSFENVDCDANGVIDPNDYYCFLEHMGQPGCLELGSRDDRWLGLCSSCDNCCKLSCTDPNQAVTHPELEACGASSNDGCNAHLDPNDPNSPFDPNAWEDLGVLSATTPTVICGTLWADNGARDTDWYKFVLPIQGTLTWETQSDIPLLSTPIFRNGNLDPPTIAANCPPGAPLWGYFNEPRSLRCELGGIAAPDIFRGGAEFWWIAFPDDGSAIFHGFPCSGGWNNYRVTITLTPLTCDPCLPTDRHEGETTCGPNYPVDTLNSGCDNTDGIFHIDPNHPQLDPNYFYCGKTGVWTDPNGHAVRDYDWWKIVLNGTVNRRLQFQIRAAFALRYELYAVPGDNCANKVRLDYYEFGACESSTSIFTACLTPNGSVYYVRFMPIGAADCTQFNNYRFLYSVVAEAPACVTCDVPCSAQIDNPCQSDPNGAETNVGCNGSDPNAYMAFAVGNNTYGPLYCGRLSTFTGSDGTPRADLDWFRFTQPPGRTRIVIRAKAMFRMSIAIAHGCSDPNSITHGWDRPCKGTTTSATQTYQPLTPNTQYFSVILYGNGGGDGAGEQPLKQFFFGLPCSDNRNTYELELQAPT